MEGIGGKMAYAEARELLEKAHPDDWKRINAKLDAGEPARAYGRFVQPAVRTHEPEGET